VAHSGGAVALLFVLVTLMARLRAPSDVVDESAGTEPPKFGGGAEGAGAWKNAPHGRDSRGESRELQREAAGATP